jgi:DNA-binding transcriptional LysR family regulator
MLNCNTFISVNKCYIKQLIVLINGVMVMAKIDQIQLMKLVLAIQDKGSLTAAAELLNTSLPTVVRQLAALEAHLGVILFDRTTRKIHLTDEGAIYIETARRMVGEMADLESALSNRLTGLQVNQQAPSGNISITAPVMFGRMHVLPVVNAFMANYSQITAQVLLQDALTDLVEAGIDVAFRIGEITLPDIVATKLGEVSCVVCAGPAYLKNHPPINLPSDLKQVKGIKNMALNKGNHWKFNLKNKTIDMNVPISFATNNIDAAIQHCVAGLGVGVLLSYQVESLIKQGVLVALLQDYRLPSIPVSMIYPKAKRDLGRTSLFIDFAKKALNGQFETGFAIK